MNELIGNNAKISQYQGQKKYIRRAFPIKKCASFPIKKH